MTFASFFCPPITADEADGRQDQVVNEITKILDEYVDSHDVSVMEMHVALENYRTMLAVNSRAIKSKRERPL